MKLSEMYFRNNVTLRHLTMLNLSDELCYPPRFDCMVDFFYSPACGEALVDWEEHLAALESVVLSSDVRWRKHASGQWKLHGDFTGRCKGLGWPIAEEQLLETYTSRRLGFDPRGHGQIGREMFSWQNNTQ